jgi:hypothetical protein
MPAPKGNKFAVKKNPKRSGYRLKLTPENLATLKAIAQREKVPMSHIFEKALLLAYPTEFTGKF